MLKITRTLSLLGVVLLSSLSLITTGCSRPVHKNYIETTSDTKFSDQGMKVRMDYGDNTDTETHIRIVDPKVQMVEAAEKAKAEQEKDSLAQRIIQGRCILFCNVEVSQAQDDTCNKCTKPAPKRVCKRSNAPAHVAQKLVQQTPTVTVIQTNNNGVAPQQQPVPAPEQPVPTAQTWNGSTPDACMVNGVNECAPHYAEPAPQPASYGYYPPYDQQMSQWNVGLVWVEGRGYCRRQEYPRERPRQPREPRQPRRPNNPVTKTPGTPGGGGTGSSPAPVGGPVGGQPGRYSRGGIGTMNSARAGGFTGGRSFGSAMRGGSQGGRH